MVMTVAEAFFIAATVPILLAGGLHVLYTLVDVVRPTYFAPVERSVQPAMERTHMRFGGRSAPTMWHAWLGFNISHGLGVFAFGLVCLLIAVDDFALVGQVPALRALTIALPAVYLVVALRFWFWQPTLIVATSTACFLVSAVLSA
jgi:hypothetical protein